MTITAAFVTQAKIDALAALLPAGNTFKMALFPSAATLDANTTVYSAANEVVGAGYAAGGQVLTGLAFSAVSGVAMATFNNPSWANATFTARGAVIYDSTNGNKVRAVIDFGADITATGATFLVTLPVVAPATSLLKIA